MAYDVPDAKGAQYYTLVVAVFRVEGYTNNMYKLGLLNGEVDLLGVTLAFPRLYLFRTASVTITSRVCNDGLPGLSELDFNPSGMTKVMGSVTDFGQKRIYVTRVLKH